MQIEVPGGWQRAKLETIMDEVARNVSVIGEQTYRLLGVRWYCDGPRHHDTFSGVDLKTATLNQVSAGQITYNKMWVKKAAFAILGESENGLFATKEYPTFNTRLEKLDLDFMKFIMETKTFQADAASRCKGTTSRARLHPRDFLQIELPLPPLPEQRKIATILSSVDEAIQATQAVIEQTRRVKEGLLQELLTKGIGHTRFKQTPIGEIPEGWGVSFLDQVAERGSGHTPSKQYPEYWNGGITWVSLSDSNALDRVYLSKTKKMISQAGIENSSAVLHPAGTVFVSRDAAVGRSAIAARDLAVSQHFIAWRCGSTLNNHFLYYFLQHHKHKFERIAVGSTIKTIGLGYFKKLQIPLPPRQEQDFIADVLLANDKSNWAHEAQLLQLQQIKSGLLQDLLTGKVRVSP